MGAPIISLTRKISDLFPPDHPDTPWLLRLAILRDDISYELSQLVLEPDDPPSAVWRCSYMLRKIGITIDEATSIFRSEVQRRVSDIEVEHGKELARAVSDAIEALRSARAFLKPLRDSLGAHVDPSFSNKRKVDPTAEVIRAYGDSEFYVVLDMHNGRITTFRELTTSAFLFAWPEVKTNDDMWRQHEELSSKLLACLGPAMRTIDMFLFFHWRSLGLIRW